jgi:hypothetical protein
MFILVFDQTASFDFCSKSNIHLFGTQAKPSFCLSVAPCYVSERESLSLTKIQR